MHATGLAGLHMQGVLWGGFCDPCVPSLEVRLSNSMVVPTNMIKDPNDKIRLWTVCRRSSCQLGFNASSVPTTNRYAPPTAATVQMLLHGAAAQSKSMYETMGSASDRWGKRPGTPVSQAQTWWSKRFACDSRSLHSKDLIPRALMSLLFVKNAMQGGWGLALFCEMVSKFIRETAPPQGCIGKGGGGGHTPLPLQGAQPMPSHYPPDAKCQLQWHL